MTDSVQAVPPVNATITIQPVATTAPNHDGGSPPSQNPLANLANGTTVEGYVVNRDAQNNPILRTSIGDLQVASDIFLKTGSEVTIKVDNSLPSLAKILSVDGMTPQDYSAQNTRGITQDTITTHAMQPLLNVGTAQPANNSALPVGTPILQALVLQAQEAVAQPLLTSALAAAQSGPANVMAQLSQLSAGTPIRLALLDIKLPPVPVSLKSLPESSALDSFLPPKPLAGHAQQPLRSTEGQSPASAYRPVTGQQQPPLAAPQQTRTGELFPGIPAEENPVLARLPLQQEVLTAKLATQAPQTLPAAVSIAHPPEVVRASVPVAITQALPAAATPATAEAPSPKTAASQVVTSPAAQTPTPTPAHAQLNQPSAPNQLVANVIGHDADGANILQTPFATLKVYTPQPLPTGTTLLVQADIAAPQKALAPQAAAPQPTVAIAPLQSVAQSLTGELSAFGDVLSWLASNQPDIARDVQNRLPNLSANLTATMLNYIAGVGNGDVTEIIGKRAVRMLEASAPEILARLRHSVGEMQAHYTESPLPHWTVIPLPMWLGAELQQLQLFISKDPPQQEEPQSASQKHGQRFVLEVGLSHIGDMQFDGFVRERNPAKSFDLMVRTAAALPQDVTQGIRTIFENSMQVTGMQGQVIFQHGRQHFVKPLAEAPATRFEGGANTILA